MRKRKNPDAPKRQGWLRTAEERKELSKRRSRDKVLCPECGDNAERSPSNGTWRCLATQDIQTNMGSTISIVTCGARGHTVNDDLVTTEAPKRED